MSRPVPLCQGFKDDGSKCGSPALRGHQLCYFHNRRAMHHSISPNHPIYTVPPLTNVRNIRKATENALRLLQQERLSKQQVAIMLRGLRIALDGLPKLQPSRKKRSQPCEPA